MTDSTREHRRVTQSQLPGRRHTLSLGTLFIPEKAKIRATMPLYIHFHGAAWLAEHSAHTVDRNAVVLSVHLGQGSRVYSRAFADSSRYRALLQEAAEAIAPGNRVKFSPVIISSFSAGYGATREILSDRGNWDLVQCVVLADGLHVGYVPEGKPGPLATESLKSFTDFATGAVSGSKHLVVTHSEIFPGTFASTTDTADFLLSQLSLKRRPVLRWGPLGMQQLSEVRAGGFRLLGFAGNTAPDHVDHFHALSEWLKLCR